MFTKKIYIYSKIKKKVLKIYRNNSDLRVNLKKILNQKKHQEASKEASRSDNYTTLRVYCVHLKLARTTYVTSTMFTASSLAAIFMPVGGASYVVVRRECRVQYILYLWVRRKASKHERLSRFTAADYQLFFIFGESANLV